MCSLNSDLYNCYPGIFLLVNNEMGVFIELTVYLMCALLKKENLQVTQELIHFQEWFLSYTAQISVITEYFFCL